MLALVTAADEDDVRKTRAREPTGTLCATDPGTSELDGGGGSSDGDDVLG